MFGGRTASRRYFVAGECFSRQFQHYVVRSGDSLVMPSPATSMMLRGIGRTQRYKRRSSTSQIQYAGLFIRTDELPSYGPRRSDIPL